MAPKVGEKGVALKVDENAASHLSPLHAPVHKGGLAGSLPDPDMLYVKRETYICILTPFTDAGSGSNLSEI